MARKPTEQRRDAPIRDAARDQAPQGRPRAEPRRENIGTAAGQARQQQSTDRNRPFAPGEDGESH